MSAEPIRVAMWSGPRNVSTALLRAFENRPDTVVVDEPLYACYLAETGLDHPGREAILASLPADADEAVARLLAPLPLGKTCFFQKHMAHHLLPSVGRAWLDEVRHAFLIRDPAEMIASYAKVRPRFGLADLGMPQMSEIFERERARLGEPPPVVDAKDLLLDPRGVLTRLCARLGLAFDERMLAWPAGKRASDGVWAPYWYASVERSSGFEPYRPRAVSLSGELRSLLAECEPYYRALFACRLVA